MHLSDFALWSVSLGVDLTDASLGLVGDQGVYPTCHTALFVLRVGDARFFLVSEGQAELIVAKAGKQVGACGTIHFSGKNIND